MKLDLSRTFGPLHFKLKLPPLASGQKTGGKMGSPTRRNPPPQAIPILEEAIGKWMNPNFAYVYNALAMSHYHHNKNLKRAVEVRRREIPDFSLPRRNFIPLSYVGSEIFLRPRKIHL